MFSAVHWTIGLLAAADSNSRVQVWCRAGGRVGCLPRTDSDSRGRGHTGGVDRAGYLSSLQPTIKSGQTCKTATKR